MPGLLINIDVPDLDRAAAFYVAALGLRIGRRLAGGVVELLGADASIYLLEKAAGTPIGPAGGGRRGYDRHWCPIHLDLVVGELDPAIARAVAAGAVREGDTIDAAYGRLAMFADPFGHGFCLIEFGEAGYDAIVAAPGPH